MQVTQHLLKTREWVYSSAMNRTCRTLQDAYMTARRTSIGSNVTTTRVGHVDQPRCCPKAFVYVHEYFSI